jgi:uncharacterized SAM-binding protein YcdF (DUF218 family)
MPARDRFAVAGSPFARRALAAELVVVLALLTITPFIGRILHVEDPLERADAIFVLAGSRTARWLEARDLVSERYAPLIVLSQGARDAEELQLDAQGVHLPSEGQIARDALIALGMPSDQVHLLAGFPDSTAEEAVRFRQLALARGWRTVLVVTSKLHTRRAAFAMRRAFEGTAVRVVIRATRYDEDDPARWWRKRRTIRSVMYEVPKLVAYLFGLGP